MLTFMAVRGSRACGSEPRTVRRVNGALPTSASVRVSLRGVSPPLGRKGATTCPSASAEGTRPLKKMVHGEETPRLMAMR